MRGLYAITPEGPGLVEKVRAALHGGIALLQYRRKSGNRAEADAIIRLAKPFAVPVIINDDVELGLRADGAHLGKDDGDLSVARKKLQGKILGASCYDRLDLARSAVAAGADYVAFGSFHASSVKPGAGRAEVSLLERARTLGVPVIAIGGVTAQNAHALFAAGADAVAVISAVFDHAQSSEIELAARALDAVYRAASKR